MATIRGTRDADMLRGRATDDLIHGWGGDDRLLGFGGVDILRGGAGDDWLDGGQGDDWLVGGSGADTLIDGLGADRLDGGTGDDMIHVDPAAGFGARDRVDGGGGHDTLVVAGDGGGAVLDLAPAGLIAGIEAIAATGYRVIATAHTFRGLDTLVADALIVADGGDLGTYAPSHRLGEIRFSDAGNRIDLSLHEGAPIRIVAGAGDDVIVGTEGRDDWFGLDGGAGDDSIFGRGGIDQIVGGEGDDLLRGGDAADTLYGGTGDDRLDGGTGNDWLDGGEGTDTLIGGEGDDLLRAVLSADDRFVGGDGFDTLVASGDLSLAFVAADVEMLRGPDASDDAALVVAADRLPGFASIAGRIVVAGRADLDLAGRMETGVLMLGADDDRVTLGDARSGRVSVRGGDGADTLTAALAGSGLSGEDGDDVLVGRAGDDTLNGGAGDDRLAGGGGWYDSYTGGRGADLFDVSGTTRGATRITDFEAGADRIDVSAWFADFDAMRRALGQADGDPATGTIALSRDVILYLSNVDTATLTAGDFVFA